MSAYKQPVSVLVVIYTERLDVLLLERADHPEFWQSVTGSCEPGEQVLHTALRELYEETGIQVAADELDDWQQQQTYEIYPQWRHRYPPGVTENTEHVFGLQLTCAVEVRIAPREHLAYQWLSWQQAADLVFSPSNCSAIQQLPSRLNKGKP